MINQVRHVIKATDCQQTFTQSKMPTVCGIYMHVITTGKVVLSSQWQNEHQTTTTQYSVATQYHVQRGKVVCSLLCS